MEVEIFAEKVKNLGVDTITGIPDSALKQFCDYIGNDGKNVFSNHIVPENEGAAIGLAIGEYLATGKIACVYMQNSGLGNVVNPLTSLAHADIYGIPMLLLVGWRGEPGIKDEPQHKFMGKITTGLLELLEITYAIIDNKTTLAELEGILDQAQKCFSHNKQFAIVIRQGTFDQRELSVYENGYCLAREDAIKEIVKWIETDNLVVSTTGKISRELYEQMDLIKGNHKQAFLTVGGMGHAKMIAYGIAQREQNRRVICLDGDGAVLMHMGGMAVIGSKPLNNFVHICLDNEAHESVGGMPTGAVGIGYYKLAEECGYVKVYVVTTKQELRDVLDNMRQEKKMTFVQIKVALGARDNLGRPKESPEENKRAFMELLG